MDFKPMTEEEIQKVESWDHGSEHAMNHIRACQQEIQRLTALVFPEKLTTELEEVLGTMNFQSAPLAQAFRDAGEAQIKNHLEEEQAFVLHHLVLLVLKHGTGWRDAFSEELRLIIPKAEAAIQSRRAVK